MINDVGMYCLLSGLQHIMFAPAEERAASIAATGLTDTFGTGTDLFNSPFGENYSIQCVSCHFLVIVHEGLRPQSLQHLESLEAEASNTMFLILSDIQLDQPLVPEKLLEVFQGFEATYVAMTGQSEGTGDGSYDNDFADEANAPHLVFTLIGSFVTKPIAVPGGRQAAHSTFDSLADIIASCPHIAANAKFVLVPGNSYFPTMFYFVIDIVSFVGVWLPYVL